MFIERLLNQGNAPLLEQVLKFHAARAKLIAENVANISTPNYRQKDLSVDKFQAMLQERASEKETAPPGSVGFSDIGASVQEPTSSILYHDGGNRSIEQIETDQAKNGMMHNLVVELLRKQYAALDMALKERVG
jgi:flagellar basal-body rod protein FlgB